MSKKRQWNDVSIAERDKLLDLKTKEGNDALRKLHSELNLKMNPTSLIRKIDDHAQYSELYRRNAAAQIEFPPSPSKQFVDYLDIDLDDAIIISDVEIPDHNVEILKASLLVAMKYNIKTLIIAGDLIATDQDALNSWVSTWQVDEDISYEESLNLVVKILKQFEDWFDNIYVIEGNHDDRISRKTGGAVHLGMFLTGTKVIYSRYSYMWLKTSRGDTWITHPSNFSSDPVRLGQELYDVQPRKCHIIVAHCHRHQDGHTKDGAFEVHALGTCRDPWRTKYKASKANKHRQWDESFLMMKNGYYYPFDMKSTDWNFWLGVFAESLSA